MPLLLLGSHRSASDLRKKSLDIFVLFSYTLVNDSHCPLTVLECVFFWNTAKAFIFACFAASHFDLHEFSLRGTQFV